PSGSTSAVRHSSAFSRLVTHHNRALECPKYMVTYGNRGARVPSDAWSRWNFGHSSAPFRSAQASKRDSSAFGSCSELFCRHSSAFDQCSRLSRRVLECQATVGADFGRALECLRLMLRGSRQPTAERRASKQAFAPALSVSIAHHGSPGFSSSRTDKARGPSTRPPPLSRSNPLNSPRGLRLNVKRTGAW